MSTVYFRTHEVQCSHAHHPPAGPGALLRDLGVLRTQILTIAPTEAPPVPDVPLTAWVPSTYISYGYRLPDTDSPLVEDVYPEGKVKTINLERYGAILAARTVLYTNLDR